MASKHRVTVRVTRLEGRQGSLTASNIIYANELTDITIPIAEVLDGFPTTSDNTFAPTKAKKK